MQNEKNTTIIDLRRDDRVGFTDNDQLFHRQVYRKLAERVQAAISSSGKCLASTEKEGKINIVRLHNAVLLDGDRGTGKTSLLVNLSGYFSREDDFKKGQDDILFLDPIDPTLLHDSESFLNVAIAQINRCQEVASQLKAPKSDAYKNSYYDALEKLATAMEGEQTSGEKIGLDRLMSYQGSLTVAEETHAYLRAALKLVGKKLIVMPIDDVDMSLSHGFKVLEVVRKHLCSPYVLPIVSGDLHLYSELVLQHFWKELRFKDATEVELTATKIKAQELTEEYLRKVFPVQSRLRVPVVGGYFIGPEHDGVHVKTVVRNNDNVEIDLKSLGNMLYAVLNGRVNGEEKSAVSPGLEQITARRLLQLLKALPQKFFDLFTKEGFETEIEAQRCWLRQNRETAHTIYAKLAEHFQYTQQPRLHELCKGLASLNLVDKNGVRYVDSLTDVIYLNPHAQISIENVPLRHNENYAVYVEENALFGKQRESLPEDFLEEKIPSLVALPAIEPVDSQLTFKTKWRPRGTEGIYDDGDFLKELFCHSDFYSSYQTSPIVFFGRFFELMTVSLVRKVNLDWLERLLAKPPYYSIISVGATKTFDFVTETGVKDEIPNVVDDKMEDGRKKYFEKLIEALIEFQAGAENDAAFFDLSLLQSVQSKYFNQLNLYKLGRRGRGIAANKQPRDRLVNEDLLKEIALRSAYVYWSSFGSFEMGKLFFEIPKKVPHQNFASLTKINETNVRSKNPMFNNCIRPFILPSPLLLRRDSFTERIADHPVMLRIFNWIERVFDHDVVDEERILYSNLQQVVFEVWARLKNVRVAVNPRSRPYNYGVVSRVLADMARVNLSIQDIFPKDEKIQQTLVVLSDLNAAAREAIGVENEDAINKFMVRFGLLIQKQYFYEINPRNQCLDILLRRIWSDLLDENEEFVRDRGICATRLIAQGVDSELAGYLTAGFNK